MKCPKCAESLNLVAEELDDGSDQIEVRAECTCGYWSYAFLSERDFITEE